MFFSADTHISPLSMIAVCVGLFVCPGSPRAEKGFACVECAGPARTYACSVMSDDSVPPQAVRLFCMAQIARDHAHESCAVIRNAPACVGQEVSYVYQDGVGGQPASTDAADVEPSPKPPTLADMTRATMEASAKAGKAVGEATLKAGEAVGEATKRTLKCLGSALNGC